MRKALAAVAALAACGGGSSQGPIDAPNDDFPDAFVEFPDAGLIWEPLISRSWSLQPMGEEWECTRMQVTSDTWIAGFRELAPAGTDELVLTVSSTATPLGDYDCSAASVDTTMIYAAGIRTDDLVFPTAAAVHVSAGQYLNLNVHLSQLGTSTLTGTSGVLVATTDPSLIAHPVDMFFAGTVVISIPSNDMPKTQQGGCSAGSDYHIVSLWPHMHALGTHQQLVVGDPSTGTSTTLLDADYSVSSQVNHPVADTDVAISDTITTTCTWVNDTGTTVVAGDTVASEQCFTGIYEYSIPGSMYSCVTGI
ncbi:MAG TPA: hypothetical protein VMJ10_34450 [Kofleriaceae bacterium]|nr:hypothetical protein [Kofleriaceae bacterium]